LTDDTQLRAGDEVLTFVSRNLEPYRGYHIPMCALRRFFGPGPNCHVVIVGADGVSYGMRPTAGTTYRQKCVSPAPGRT
jgi:hypothetical protein